MKQPRIFILFVFFSIATLFLFFFDLGVGSIEIPFNEVLGTILGYESSDMHYQIIMDIRLTKALVALLSGAALSVSGLQMQTLFRNPLAGPYVLGISSGASLGVALFILGLPFIGVTPNSVPFGVAGAAWVGAAVILVIIGFLAQRVKDIMVVLIIGMMLSSGISAIVQILQYLSHDEALKSFVIWTMGSLGDVTNTQLPILTIAVIIGLILAGFSVKPLNQLLLGEEYAMTMGMNVNRTRGLLFSSTTLLAGTVTAFCGPIGFIGLAMPHISRMIFNTADHRILIPANILTGAFILILCDIISKIWVLPINAITSLIGIPIIIFVVLKFR